uniref:SPOR domain-containing protein n=1 Tax=Falsiroseomonas oryziterrae TaxID=2911368 RepID=UPI001F48836A
AAQPPAQRLAAPVPNGRVQVQLGALTSEEAARTEWDRLSRRAPELFQGRTPQILRLDRGAEQAPLFRLRTGGIADAEAAQQFCEQVRARGGACVVVRS